MSNHKCIYKMVLFLMIISPFVFGCQEDGSIYNFVLERVAVKEYLLFSSLKVHQSMAFYGEYAAFVTPEGRTLKCDLFGIESGNQLASVVLPYGGYPTPHANAACFGDSFFSGSSILPVLYVSSWDKGRQAFVYDISKFGDDYSASLIQVIDPSGLNTDIVGEGYMDWVIDSEGGNLFSLSYHLKGTSLLSDGNCTHVTKYRIPSLEDELVILEDTDILDSFIVPVMTVFQDKAFYKNHQ